MTAETTAAPPCPSWCRTEHDDQERTLAGRIVHQDSGELVWVHSENGGSEVWAGSGVWVGFVQSWDRPLGGWRPPAVSVRAIGADRYLTFARPEDVRSLAQLLAITGAEQLRDYLDDAAERLALAAAETPPDLPT